jgi:hypothetical protein
MESFRRFPFDVALMAVNAADKYHYPFQKGLLRLAVEKQKGIIGMKVMARGRILSGWTPPPVEEQKRSWEGRGAIATTPAPSEKYSSTISPSLSARQSWGVTLSSRLKNARNSPGPLLH